MAQLFFTYDDRLTLDLYSKEEFQSHYSDHIFRPLPESNSFYYVLPPDCPNTAIRKFLPVKSRGPDPKLLGLDILLANGKTLSIRPADDMEATMATWIK